jgi:hypothetical protein
MGKHIIPQKYLRGFATTSDPLQIWMYNKQSRAWSRVAIAKAVQQSNYFDAETEKKLAISVEHPAHAALSNIRVRKHITKDERDALALYIAVMMMRVPRRRRKAREMIAPTLHDVIEQLRADLLAQASSAEHLGNVQSGLRHLDTIEEKLSRDTPPEVLANIASPWPNAAVLTAVRDMPWRIATTSGPSFFLTSDNPAYFFEAFGVASVDSELTFPLASDLALLGSWQGTLGSTEFLDAKQPLVKEVNRRIASGAERFVFYRTRATWIETLVHRSDPYLSRILWE